MLIVALGFGFRANLGFGGLRSWGLDLEGWGKDFKRIQGSGLQAIHEPQNYVKQWPFGPYLGLLFYLLLGLGRLKTQPSRCWFGVLAWQRNTAL